MQRFFLQPLAAILLVACQEPTQPDMSPLWPESPLQPPSFSVSPTTAVVGLEVRLIASDAAAGSEWAYPLAGTGPS